MVVQLNASPEPESSVQSFTKPQLYQIYMEVARRDHQWRMQAMYGGDSPPRGLSPFRPLDERVFWERFQAASKVDGGVQAFTQQLLRRAQYYKVNIQQVLRHSGAVPVVVAMPASTTAVAAILADR